MRSIIALLLVAATLASAALVAPASAEETPRTITVNGNGEVSVEPDMATINIGVQTEAEDAATALDGASGATAAILATLDVEGVLPEDIRSGAIRLNPRYSQSVLSSGNQITGYQAVNSVEVIVNDLDQLGGLLAAVVGDGANRLDGVQFGLQDPSEAMDEARRRAVAEGARLAALYAGAAGVPLGDLLRLSEGGSSGYNPMRAEPVMLEMAASSPQYDVPISAGKIELRASVSLVYAIGD
ncbi:SIMPL domain-containing protein [Octadecabacter sp. 1_MG-2023]|uniref:SIMPL domain-containing protein n=1 Tax=unclassified Octadecabacter TaxID=196158 RepID=UPI001C09BC02|nr:MULTISPECIES: SIMPL domain-containing protein [unclassified Octadecabacter]MBU2992882.1 SIMPL domain-containing protein [Octadecabacter sp. B2R22]MDO6733667.1 SIMPL domain-containing protein [Octadecabacter sp. 1_MG-2023]